MDVKDAAALVTGGASGLGLATARRLAARGARVVLCDLPSSAGEAMARELGGGARFAPADVTDPAGMEAAVAAAEALGPFRVLVHCAGRGGSARVLDRDGAPIPGLYAAGEIIGLYYGTYTGATSVLKGMVFGRIAGRDAARLRNA